METNKELIETSTGYTCEIEEDAMDDMDLFEDLIIMEDPDEKEQNKILATDRVFLGIVGRRQEKALREHLRAKEGKVKISSYHREVGEVFRALKGNKKK